MYIYICIYIYVYIYIYIRGGFSGRGADALPSGIRPPADPKGPPFGTF